MPRGSSLRLLQRRAEQSRDALVADTLPGAFPPWRVGHTAREIDVIAVLVCPTNVTIVGSQLLDSLTAMLAVPNNFGAEECLSSLREILWICPAPLRWSTCNMDNLVRLTTHNITDDDNFILELRRNSCNSEYAH